MMPYPTKERAQAPWPDDEIEVDFKFIDSVGSTCHGDSWKRSQERG